MSDLNFQIDPAFPSQGIPAPDPLAPPRKEEVDLGAKALFDSTRRMQGHAGALAKEIGSVITDARRFLEKSVEENPATTLGVAAGAGYIIAGGLSSRFTRFALKTGTKLATAWALKEITEAATGKQIKVEDKDAPQG